MSNSSKRRLVLIGLENAAGALDGSMQVIETQMGFAMKAAGETIARDVARPSMSKVGSVVGAKNWDITLPMELKGGGIDTDVVQQPELHAALLACGLVLEAAKVIRVSGLTTGYTFQDTVTNTTASNTAGELIHAVQDTTSTLYVKIENEPDVGDALQIGTATATVVSVDDALLYRPTSKREDFKNVTLHAHFDGQRRIATHAVADLSFDWSAGKNVTANFTLKGNYASPSDVTMPDANYSDVFPAIVESAGLTVDDYPTDQGTIEKLGFSLSNEIVAVPDVNSPSGRDSYRIADRKPTGSVDPESLALSDFNPFEYWESGNKAAIFATLGKDTGDRVSIVLPATQFTSVTDKERAGSDAYDLPFDVTGKADNEFFLFFH